VNQRGLSSDLAPPIARSKQNPHPSQPFNTANPAGAVATKFGILALIPYSSSATPFYPKTGPPLPFFSDAAYDDLLLGAVWAGTFLFRRE